MSQMEVMISSADPSDEITLRLLPAATQTLSVTYKIFDVRTPADLDTTFAQAASDGMQGLFVNQSPFFLGRRTEVAALAARSRLPAIYGYREHAEAGGLLSYGSSLPGAYRQLARLVDKILKGAKPAELPIERRLILSWWSTTRPPSHLGLRFRRRFLLRADEVIE